MKIAISFLLSAALLLLSCTAEPTRDEDLAAYVDPFIGTDYHGHVFLGASVPFGAVQLGPTNFTHGWDWCSGYHYSDSLLIGFSHLHLSGTGIGDLGDVLVMPYTGPLKQTRGTIDNPESGFGCKYEHALEKAAPGYYSVHLQDYDIHAELTASARVGMHRYTFPQSDDAHLAIDLGHGIGWDSPVESFIEQVDDTTLIGYRFSKGWCSDQRLWFAILLSKPLAQLQIFADGAAPDAPDKIAALTAMLNFSTAADEVLLIKVGISPVSSANALANIRTEIPGWDFDSVVDAARTAWNGELRKIAISAPSEAQMRAFYTALYHAMIAPVLFNDANGDYRGTDKKVYEKAPFQNYSIFSLWDTYRAAHPLYTIIQPDRVADMVQSMLAIDAQQGKLPVWHLMGSETNTMVGYHAVPVIVDAIFKGIAGIDAEQALAAAKRSAMLDEEGLNHLKEVGYIPAEKEVESVAKALEYAIDDWCIAQLAQSLGKTADYDYFLQRAKAYERYFDPTTRFMRGVMADGSWRTPFDPVSASHRNDDYCEGNAWQYTWLVPHDVEGLINLFGDAETFVRKLDSLFIVDSRQVEGASIDISGLIGQYAHGNEPGHHTPYLYAFAGQQWKSAAKVRQIMDTFYTDEPDGLCGNEDCGQMSAWYIFSALGFYPVNPANGVYVFGSPLVERAEIRMPGDKVFRIVAKNNSAENIYIQSVRLNGQEYSKSYILHQDIVNGGEIEFVMAAEPNAAFGSAAEDRPTSKLDRP
ncbi:GH92 family glycosyl hydrolase [candidate division KSB1 bacterium]|nr:GH92 family glycosyl hydrolase [candidate division KSB1 bacterium]RQW04458.1 MAG: glycoside hydrolase family 92 protein [candidate division KSB1 bacterium]